MVTMLPKLQINKYKNTLIFKNRKNITVFLLTCSICILFFLFFLKLVNAPNGEQRSIFFSGTNDLFADFFNVLRYISERDPYFNTTNGLGEKIYLPISYFLLYPFSKLDDFGNMSLFEAQSSHLGMLSFVFFTIFSMFLFYSGLKKVCKKYNVDKYIILSFVLSYPMLFAIERGNLIIISAAAVFLFIAYYDSVDIRKRYIACAALAFSISLKIYPVIFGFLFLNKKEYKEIIFCIIITVLIVFLPFFFFKHGLGNISQLMQNISISSKNYNYTNKYPRFGMPNLIYIVSFYFLHSVSFSVHLANIAVTITIVFVILSVILSSLIGNDFLKITLLASCVINLPTNSALYTGLYFFPVIISYFYEKENRRFLVDVFFTVMFIFFLSPFQIYFSNRNVSQYVVQFISILLWIIVLIYSCICIYAKLKKGRTA